MRPNHDDRLLRDRGRRDAAPGLAGRHRLRQLTSASSPKGIREPILPIFVWTCIFACLTVLFTFALGILLASILQWPLCASSGVYRILLILPYAVPAFISILVFRGLFNQNFGEINLILRRLFGIKPDWFTDPFLAKAMLVIVNVWLGYPVHDAALDGLPAVGAGGPLQGGGARRRRAAAELLHASRCRRSCRPSCRC